MDWEQLSYHLQESLYDKHPISLFIFICNFLYQAIQSFDVLRKVGRHIRLNIGLAIGGKSSRDEAEVVKSASILVCTPGGLLYHLDSTPEFDTSNLLVLGLLELLCHMINF